MSRSSLLSMAARASVVALGTPVCVLGLALSVPAQPASAAAARTSCQWLWEGDAQTVASVRELIGASELPVSLTGRGVGVALVDTGVAAVPGLKTGNVVNGPDLSFDGQDPAKRYIDLHGHGTHMAGIISARTSELTGLAPDAKLTSIKVGSASGAVDVTQVMAAVDWAVQHRNDDYRNPIKVLVLAYGTDSAQNYAVDPLSAAVENAWRAGIAVVVAGGNAGNKARLVNPATDPFVISVAAMDDNATRDAADDKVADFTSLGDASRKADFVAPGRSIVSLRAPGSYVDVNYPAARLGTAFTLGSGSSQAAAVTAAVAADLFQQFPSLTPDQLKKLLTANEAVIVGDVRKEKPGTPRLLNISKPYNAYKQYPSDYSVSRSAQKFPKATGLGSLEAARGSVHVLDGSVPLSGENDIFGPFSTAAWAAASARKAAWVGGAWMGRDWTGNSWATSSAGLSSWSGRAWSGRAWSGRAWSAEVWASVKWNDADWS